MLTSHAYEDKGPGAVFRQGGMPGSSLPGVMDVFDVATAIALRDGVPLEAFVSTFINMLFELAGMTDDQDVRIASSMMDYIFRRLALDYLPSETRAALGILRADERTEQLDAGESSKAEGRAADAAHPTAAHSTMELLEAQQGLSADAPLCLSCGIKMLPSGSCYTCESCGSTSGCS